VTLYLSERCNSRCITCDYWRHGHRDLSLQTVRDLLPSLRRLGTAAVLISGGEPLLNAEWAEIAQLLRAQGLKLWLLTSGLSLAKHALRAAKLFDTITVSLDGTRPETYAAIRGLDAFDNVCAGMRAAAAAGARVSVRVTLQRANYRELLGFVALARASGARQVSFLAVDVANPHAFARQETSSLDLALREDDLSEFERLLEQLEQVYAGEFRSGFIAESPPKMRRLLQYFRAVNGLGSFPAVRCNAPEFSAVVAADGGVKPCFFIPGPASAIVKADLDAVLNAEPSRELRAQIRAGARHECTRCVCSMWRDPLALASGTALLPELERRLPA
jgi:MoaA/NifB/PqqE/SkfB family radical SAM enzyme